jgi:spermidine synthase
MAKKRKPSKQGRAAGASQAETTWPLVGAVAQFSIADRVSERLLKPVLYALVFSAGFANLALEVTAPRIMSSIYGTTTIVWSVIISVVLGGLAIGYYLGGRVKQKSASRVLAVVLLANAIFIAVAGWVVLLFAKLLGFYTVLTISLTAFAAFVIPAILFGMVSPLAITLFSSLEPNTPAGTIAGRVLALGTAGSILGALGATLVLVPYLGVVKTLVILSASLLVFAAFLGGARIALPLGVLLFAIPSPTLHPKEFRQVVAEVESTYQNIRVLRVRDTDQYYMQLGAVNQTAVDVRNKTSLYTYATNVVRLANPFPGQEVLGIGGAGHGIAFMLEQQGAHVTLVEIDPKVEELSSRYFGPIKGKVEIEDARSYLNRIPERQFDVVVFDASNGPGTIPIQLTSLEFFQAVDRALKPNGRLIYYFAGHTEGEYSEAFKAFAATMHRVFKDVKVYADTGEGRKDILLLGSDSAIDDAEMFRAPDHGEVITDDRNPMEIYLSRIGYSFWSTSRFQ